MGEEKTLDIVLRLADTLKNQKDGEEPPKIGRNWVLGKIGDGAYVEVFKVAFDEGRQLLGALKLPRNQGSVVEVTSHRTILSALGRCPYIVNMIDQGEEEGVPYFVEEYGDRTLTSLLNEYKDQESQSPNKFPATELIHLARSLLEAVDYLHRLGSTNPQAARMLKLKSLCHSDIKPSNVLLFTDPKTGKTVYKLTDLGVRLEQQGEVVGVVNTVTLLSLRDDLNSESPNIYAHPEVRDRLLADLSITPKTVYDLWSVGAILYRAATGRLPGYGSTNPCDERTDLPDSLGGFFNRLLMTDERKNFSTAQEALKELEACIEDDSVVLALTHGESSDYSLVAQPMRSGKMVGIRTRYEFNCDEVPRPQVWYIPDTESFILVTKEEHEEKPNLVLRLFDRNLSKKGEAAIFRGSDDENFDLITSEIVRETDGRIAFRARRSYDRVTGSSEEELPNRTCLEDQVVYLPRLKHGAGGDFKRTSPTQRAWWGGKKNTSWKQIVPSAVSPSKIHSVFVEEGRVMIAFDKTTYSLGINRAIYAMWAPK